MIHGAGCVAADEDGHGGGGGRGGERGRRGRHGVVVRPHCVICGG